MPEAPVEPRRAKLRRAAITAVVVVVMVAGVGAITGQILRWIPAAPAATATASTVDERRVEGLAEQVAVDYLSWDVSDRARRSAALARVAAPGRTIDGWDGNGRQRADTPILVGLTHDNARHAVATVRARVTAWTGTATLFSMPGPVPGQAGGVPATAPDAVPPAGLTALPARWVSVAIALGLQGDRWVVTARPALVGEHTPAPHISTDDLTIGDDGLARATRETAAKMLTAFATGDLEFVRATGSTVAGLDRLAELGEVTSWTVRTLPAGAGPAEDREAAARVVWKLPGGAELTCGYLLRLRQAGDRWALTAVMPVTSQGRL